MFARALTLLIALTLQALPHISLVLLVLFPGQIHSMAHSPLPLSQLLGYIALEQFHCSLRCEVLLLLYENILPPLSVYEFVPILHALLNCLCLLLMLSGSILRQFLVALLLYMLLRVLLAAML